MQVTMRQVRNFPFPSDKREGGELVSALEMMGQRQLETSIPMHDDYTFSLGDVAVALGTWQAAACSMFLEPRDRVKVAFDSVRRAVSAYECERSEKHLRVISKWMNGGPGDLETIAEITMKSAVANASVGPEDCVFSLARAQVEPTMAPGAMLTACAAQLILYGSSRGGMSLADALDLIRLDIFIHSPPIIFKSKAS